MEAPGAPLGLPWGSIAWGLHSWGLYACRVRMVACAAHPLSHQQRGLAKNAARCASERPRSVEKSAARGLGVSRHRLGQRLRSDGRSASWICGATLERSRRLPNDAPEVDDVEPSRLQTARTGRKIPKRQKSSASAGELRSYPHLLALRSRCQGAPQVSDWQACTGAAVVEATSHFVQATATGPLIS
jgi:hypothetical protein